MRWLPLTTLIVLATLTELAYRPLLALGPATPDVAFLFLLWLAHFDGRSRVHVAVVLVAGSRVAHGVEGILAAWLPLAAGVEAMLLLRRLRAPRDRFWRLLIVCAVTAGTLFVDALLRDGWSAPVGRCGRGAAFAALWGLILFPILDAAKPLLRSPAYPEWQSRHV